MLITDIIKNHETSLIKHYKAKGESKLGYTTIHDLKQKIDYYNIKDVDEWNKTYLKELSSVVKDHGIAVKV